MATDLEEIVQTFWQKLADSPFVMLGLEGSGTHAIPMKAVLDKDANHCVWFYTSRRNRLAKGGRSMMQFASKGHDLFACVAGELVEETDPAVIDRYWSNSVAAWFDGGREDPDLLMLRLDLGNAEIWEADPGVAGIFKMVTGRQMNDGDMGEHATVAL